MKVDTNLHSQMGKLFKTLQEEFEDTQELNRKEIDRVVVRMSKEFDLNAEESQAMIKAANEQIQLVKELKADETKLKPIDTSLTDESLLVRQMQTRPVTEPSGGTGSILSSISSMFSGSGAAGAGLKKTIMSSVMAAAPYLLGGAAIGLASAEFIPKIAAAITEGPTHADLTKLLGGYDPQVDKINQGDFVRPNNAAEIKRFAETTEDITLAKIQKAYPAYQKDMFSIEGIQDYLAHYYAYKSTADKAEIALAEQELLPEEERATLSELIKDIKQQEGVSPSDYLREEIARVDPITGPDDPLGLGQGVRSPDFFRDYAKDPNVKARFDEAVVRGVYDPLSELDLAEVQSYQSKDDQPKASSTTIIHQTIINNNINKQLQGSTE